MGTYTAPICREFIALPANGAFTRQPMDGSQALAHSFFHLLES
jgi:hypothetical protein